MRPEDFAAGVMDQLSAFGHTKSAGWVRASAGAAAGASSAPVGHPDFARLEIGEMGTCSLAVAFIDMRGTTARSFWEPLSQVASLSLAVLSQVSAVVQESGGHVLGLRGDGLMAGWGDPRSDADVDIGLMMAACSFSLDAVQNVLNRTLEWSGIAPVQIRAGADWGELCFARTGTEGASEVNVVGHPANFAAKCEKYAKAWEVVVGEGAAQALDPVLLTPHEKSPKTYTHQGERRTYGFYDLSWRPLVSDAATAIAQVAGLRSSSVRAVWKEN